MPQIRTKKSEQPAAREDEGKSGPYKDWKTPLNVDRPAGDSGPKNTNLGAKLPTGFPNPMGFGGLGKD